MTKEIVDLLDSVSRVGMPIVICIVVIWGVVKVFQEAPIFLKSWLDQRQAQNERQQERYDDMLSRLAEQNQVITTVAQQGIETMKRSNEVIERNNLILEENQKNFIQITQALHNVTESLKDSQREIKDCQDLQRTTLIEVSKTGENVRHLDDHLSTLK